MKKHLPYLAIALFFMLAVSCSRNAYKAGNFEEKTEEHQVVAVLPAEMIFTGKQPNNLTPEDIAKIEIQESKDFQVSLYNSVLRHANGRKYQTSVNFQDVTTTLRKLEENGIDIRKSWTMDDKELAALLGVDAVVKMRIKKQRYMSDHASYGVNVAKQIIGSTKLGSKLPIPYNVGKTNDIHASCNLISENQTLWNDNYRSSADWNSPANEIIEVITDNFGQNFPYKYKKRKK
jgi:hypothetical protein